MNYACKLHQQQLHEGQDYFALRPTISISFLNHIRFPQAADYHLRFRLLDEVHQLLLTDDLEFHLLELPKFDKPAEKLTTGLDRWLYFLRHAEMMDVEALHASLQQPLVVRALEELKMLTQTDLERERYEARRKAQLDENTLVNVARLEGEQKGRLEGEQKGRLEGEQQGRLEGEQIGLIHAYERLLNRPETSAVELAARGLAELKRLADELQQQVLKR